MARRRLSPSAACCTAGRRRGLPLELLSGAGGLERVITSPHIQKTGLALAGFDEYLQPGRVLVFGESEVRYLESLEPSAPPALAAVVHATTFPAC